MTKKIFKVLVTQVFRVEAEVIMEVEARDQDEAVELVDMGTIDKPDHFQWKQHWELQNEEVLIAHPNMVSNT